jgi:uncharacterized protein (DUF4415 family)
MARKSSESSRPERLKSVRLEDIRSKPLSKKDREALEWIAARQTAGDDSEINFGDIPRLTGRQLSSMIRLRDVPHPKVAVSVRLDPQVLAWLKSKGAGHLTRINDILMNLMEAEQKRK